jgi:hypothetical protein
MRYSIFSQDHVKQVGKADLEVLLEVLRNKLAKDILLPLETLNKTRPGNPNNESALKILYVLSKTLKATHNTEETATKQPAAPAA